MPDADPARWVAPQDLAQVILVPGLGRRARGPRRGAAGDGAELSAGAGLPAAAPPISCSASVQPTGYVAAVGARTTSALQTSTPFVERLVHFWSNHFAVSVDKLLVAGTGRRLRGRRHPPARAGPLRGPAARRRAPSGDAAVPRPGAVDRPGQLRRGRARSDRQQRSAWPQREPRARDPGAAHARRAQRLHAGRRHRVRARAHRLDARRRDDLRGRLAPATFRFVPALHEPGARTVLGRTLCRRRRAAGARHPRTTWPSPGDRAPHRHQARAPLRRRRSAAGAGASAWPTPSRAPAATCPACTARWWRRRRPGSRRSAKFKSPWDWTISACAALGRQRDAAGAGGRTC